MSTDIAESLPKRKFAQAAIANAKAPAAPKGKMSGGKKGGVKPVASKGGGGKGASEEGSEKRIRQAVYDIRYRARREDIDLKAAFSQYMSNSSLSQAERTAVREKLFGKAGGVSEKYINDADELAVDDVANALYKVFVEKEEKEIELAYLQQLAEDEANKKYKVRVTDNNGRQYVRFADRAKITELRQNPNIKSVEMTEYGEPYEGERKKGRQTAKAKGGGLDPVGKEDKDIDNDGDHDKTDKYLLKRRKAIGQAIRKRAGQKIKEAFLADGTVSTEAKPGTQKITGKNVDNYATGAVKVNPEQDAGKGTKKGMTYAHLELKGNPLSESQMKMFKLLADKKKKEDEELEKKDKVSSMITKDSVKNEDEKEEEKPDMRSKYAMINLIKNKLRSAGQRDPVVMMAMSPTKGQKLNMYGEETVEEGRRSPQDIKQMRRVYQDKLKKRQEGEEAAETERTPAEGDKSFDKMRPGGSNSQYNADGTKKTKKIAPKKDTAPKRVKKDTAPKGERYNPYPKAPKGKKQATPTNMAPGKP